MLLILMFDENYFVKLQIDLNILRSNLRRWKGSGEELFYGIDLSP